jgi:hypothetical protein
LRRGYDLSLELLRNVALFEEFLNHKLSEGKAGSGTRGQYCRAAVNACKYLEKESPTRFNRFAMNPLCGRYRNLANSLEKVAISERKKDTVELENEVILHGFDHQEYA